MQIVHGDEINDANDRLTGWFRDNITRDDDEREKKANYVKVEV